MKWTIIVFLIVVLAITQIAMGTVAADDTESVATTQSDKYDTNDTGKSPSNLEKEKHEVSSEHTEEAPIPPKDIETVGVTHNYSKTVAVAHNTEQSAVTQDTRHLVASTLKESEPVKEIPAQGYRILVLAPVGSRSLYHLCRSLSVVLGDAGHQITFVSSFPHSVRHEMVKEVSTGSNNSVFDDYNIFTLDNAIQMFNLMIDNALFIGKDMWVNENIKQLWRERHTFHAIIMIGYFNEIAVPFLLDFKGAYINICTPGIEHAHISLQGNWLPLSVVPSILLPYTHHMTFLERAINLPSEIFNYVSYVNLFLPSMQNFVEEFFPDMPPIQYLYWNSSVTLINGHFALDGPVPLLPTQVEIGTINAKEPQPLPQDLEEFFAGAGEAGVIVFSLGSVVKSTDMLHQYKVALVEAFRRVPQRVLWKYEGEDLDLPPNVITRKWIPQQDALGHNQTRVFMSHCGNLGLQEAMYHGVPVLALPVVFDQPRNAARMARKGYAVVLNWRDLSVDTLMEAITTLTSDPQYQARLSEVSRAVKDQAESPGQRAVWWVEYAIRHRGSPHLLYAGKKLHLLQDLMIDVLLFWFVIITLTLYINFLCLRKLVRSLSRKLTNQDKDAVNKKND